LIRITINDFIVKSTRCRGAAERRLFFKIYFYTILCVENSAHKSTIISFGGLWSHCGRGTGTRGGRRFRQRAPPPPTNSQPSAYQPAKRGTRRDYSQFRRDRCSRPSRARTFVYRFRVDKKTCARR